MSIVIAPTCVIAIVAALVAAPAAHDPTAEAIERFTAIAVDSGEFGPPQAGLLEIVVNRWTSDDERDMLLGVMADEGPEAMLRELGETQRAGYIRTPVGRTYDIHLARNSVAPDGSRHVGLVTERPTGFWEAFSGPRPIDFRWTIIDLQLRPTGQGEGVMLIATRLTAEREPGTIEVEEYTLRPVRLMRVRSSKEP